MANENSDGSARTARVVEAAGTTTATPATAAGSASGTTTGSAGSDSTTDKAKAAASDAKSAVKDQALGLKDKALGSAKTAAADGKAKAVETVGGISKAFEASAAQLDENVGKSYGDLARSAASTIDGFASTLEGKDVEELLDDAKAFIRNSPAIAIGLAAAAGFAASRVIKSGLDLDDNI